MFPLIGILIAAALLFSKRKKPSAAVVAVAPAKALPTTTKAPKAPVKPTVKPAPVKAPVKANPKPPTSSIEGLPLPSASHYAADLFGSLLDTNPRVLSPSLPYGYYNPSTNNTGSETPPIFVPTYR
jgi:hypothetical protein